MALNDLTNQNIQDTYQKVVQTDGVNIADGTGSALPIKFDGPDLIVSGALRAQSYIVSESVVNVSSGSTVFGDSADDSHTFNGNITSSGTISASGMIQTAGAISSSTGITASDAFFSTHVTASGTVKAEHLYSTDDATIDDDLTVSGVINAGESYEITGTTVIDITGTGLSTTLEIGETSAPNAIFKGHSTFLTAVSDIYLDAAGGQIYMRDDSTTYFTFNVDATPEIDIVGDLIIDPSGGDVKFSDSNINVEGHITASGTISSSGDIQGDNFIANMGSSNGYWLAGHGKPILSQDGVGGELILGQYHSTVNHSGIHLKTTGSADKGLYLDGLGNMNLTGNITSSGNISSSGTITTLGYHVGDRKLVFASSTDDKGLSFGNGGDGNLELTHITSSGAISSSGKITANSMDTATMEATRYSGGHRTLQYDAQTQVGSKAQGDIFLHHTSVSTTAGRIYKMQTNGNLTAADKDEEMSGHSLLCVAIGTDSQADGMLLRGMVKLETDPCPGTTAQVGAPVYLGDSGASTGSIESHASDDYIRILGHYMSGSGVIYFNPDSTFIKKA